ncbi:DUF6602 domain-containing protein [Flavobacterium sp. SORGH_AS_0622]|uniref:DUF6602 domain-containing protein n=1 Tax=Flavobacterium sp. SORGH_AS_0622 TaxID=3041772 RepID=UPI00278A7BDB|nr:DUF6602 domain-containing protein [Flavobacterium sp. SORGH_AS_0622]MDQ1166416.1 hypothetical protein [Flavobacterium sp. SORGH_AS_0622]
MIRTIADFLEEFKNNGLEQIATNDRDISHTVTIGNMYEGLTAEILDKAIFDGLNLKIVKNSFIYNDSNKLSKEMDCMIVIGNGTKLSFTDQFKYHISDVVAVIQVKKKLYKDAISDAHQNLKSVIDISEPRDGEIYMNRILSDSYRLLVGKKIPTKEDLPKLPFRDQILYNFLLMQSFWPIRIVIGYDTYKTENALREGFVSHLEDVTKDGTAPDYSPISFPDLIISGKNSIIKNVGMPFCLPLDNNMDFYWEILQTTNKSPMYLLLEMIWTRISYRFSLGSEIFGDDFAPESFHRFLSCRDKKIDHSNFGWEYNYYSFTDQQLSILPDNFEWEPVEIDSNESILMMGLIKLQNLTLNKKDAAFFEEKNIKIEDLVDSLVKKRLVYKEKDTLFLLLDLPILAFGNGKNYVGENKSGEMTSWMRKQENK